MESTHLTFATFNVLADAYTSYGDYGHVEPSLMVPGARHEHLSRLVNELNADVIGLQEADHNLVEMFEDDKHWQTLWLQKGRNKPDGCLTLVRSGVDIEAYEPHAYNDGTGHVYQLLSIGGLAVVNTHLKWAPLDDPNHISSAQTKEVLTALGAEQPAVILADCNDEPGGPVQTMVEKAGFTNLAAEIHTSVVDKELLSIDLLAIRGVSGHLIGRSYDLRSIPNEQCASDHIPVVAEVTVA